MSRVPEGGTAVLTARGEGRTAEVFRLDRAESPPLRAPIDLAHEAAFAIGPVHVDPATRQVIHPDGASETLEPRVMEVLVVLHRAGGSILSRDDLITACWRGMVVGEDAIQRVIQRLRKLAAATAAFRIETITRVGYRLLADHARGRDETIDEGAAPAAAHAAGGKRAAAAAITALALVAVAASIWWPTRAPIDAHDYMVALDTPKTSGSSATAGAAAFDNALRERLTSAGKINLVRGPGDFRVISSVAPDPAGVRIDAALSDARDGGSLWTSTFAVPQGEVPLIADLITAELQCTIGGAQEYPGRLTTPELRLFAQVCAALHIYTGDGPARARDLARELTMRRPDFSHGWSSLGAANTMLALYGQEGAERSRRFAEARGGMEKAVKSTRPIPKLWAPLRC